ncbi:protein FAM3C [Lampris incognitus]|uniref:protein FAM3C n=1 Tax=Lampris incognitus TaxID=2546036 RepID=UPI0024B5B07B|nr:protein FAM3C [Lampris incognitus]
MRKRDFVSLVALIVIALLIWRLSIDSPNMREKAKRIQDIFGIPSMEKTKTAAQKPTAPCSLSRSCPLDHFAFHITSGAADVVGPKICVEGKVIMSSVLNNVGPGLNMALVNGQNGTVEKVDCLNYKKLEDILAYLKAIKPGTIVLVASFDDVTKKMTDEMKEIFVGLGSASIMSLQYRDSWVFAGASGIGQKSPFEKRAANEEETNVYQGWPESVDVGGCFPRKF